MDLRNPAALGALLSGDIKNAIIASTPGGIEEQERQGGEKLRQSDAIPRKCNGCTREQLEAMGIIFGEIINDLFVRVTLPEGWQKKPTGHDMWSLLVDDKGRERASIFYKAAFYDQRAHIGITKRFSYSCHEYCDVQGRLVEAANTHRATVIMDGNTVIHQIGFVLRHDYDPMNELEKKAQAWLDEYYPEWRNPLAYWD